MRLICRFLLPRLLRKLGRKVLLEVERIKNGFLKPFFIRSTSKETFCETAQAVEQKELNSYKMVSKIVYTIFLTLLLVGTLAAQDIRLANPSFEDEPADATMPQQWSSCKRGSTPDILPGYWGVYMEPTDGETYVGLITREDGSYESIGQKLTSPFLENECYKFTLDIARSNTYANYNLPIRLRIWGGTTRCSRDQLLMETKTIKHLDWQTYPLQFTAKKTYPYIIIEAYYAKGVYFPYNGNILLDNFTVFKKCPRA